MDQNWLRWWPRHVVAVRVRDSSSRLANACDSLQDQNCGKEICHRMQMIYPRAAHWEFARRCGRLAVCRTQRHVAHYC